MELDLMPTIYQELLCCAREAYHNASSGFHPESAVTEIKAALDGFDAPLGEVGAVIARQRSGGFLSADAHATATRNALRLLEAQLTVLQTAIAGAARADRQKVARAALLDQAAFAQRAKGQQPADSQLLEQVTKLIGTVREDAAAVGSGCEADGGSSADGLKQVKVEDLRKSLHTRASSKEDEFATGELQQIGGQRSDGGGDILKPVNVDHLIDSLLARASVEEDKRATAELNQISGELSGRKPGAFSAEVDTGSA